MTAKEAISYIEAHGWSTGKTGLARTRQLLDKIGNPQKKLKFVHVAGSNGKGSTCAMLESIFRCAGYKTGLYTSPYIEEFNERIKLNGENIPDDELVALTKEMMPIFDSMEDSPSQFEMITALGMEYFYRQGCDIVILEVGLGGILDSTNVIDCPEAAVITNIGLEHTEYLGDTYAEIAKNKAGIIKPGCDCVLYDGNEDVKKVVTDTCKEKNAHLTMADFDNIIPVSQSLEGQSFIYKGERYETALIGKHQLYNSAVVLETVNVLRKKGRSIPAGAVKEGLKQVKWPARMEILSQNPLFILDGGHNPQCASALHESLTALFPGQKVIFLAGILKDKSYDKVTEILKPVAKEFVCVTPPSPRALLAEDFAHYLNKKNIPASCCEDIKEGIYKVLEISENEGLPIVCFGSLYLAGQVRKAFREIL